MSIYDHRAMDGLTPEQQSARALRHVLGRIRDHAGLGWYMGFGTESFALATEALATLDGRPVAEVRKEFEPRQPRDPRQEGREETVAGEPHLSQEQTDALCQARDYLDQQAHALVLTTALDHCAFERLRRSEQLEDLADEISAIAATHGRASE